MRKILAALFVMFSAIVCSADSIYPPPPPSGIFTTTGALKGNGSGSVSQAACADLSNAASTCSSNPVGSFAGTTPTPTVSSGSFTTATASVQALQIALPSGHLNIVNVVVTVTTVGTAAGQMFVTVPVSALVGTACAAIYNSNGSVAMVSQISGATVSIIPTAGVISNGLYFAQCTYQSS